MRSCRSNRVEVGLAKDLAQPCVVVAKDLVIDQRHLVRHINQAGVEMWQYVYWVVKTRDGTYKVSDPDDYKRIVATMNRAGVRFVKIGEDLVNIMSIDSITKKTGYKKIEEAE